MDFDCNFDAPMFVDFQNLDGDHNEQQEAEAYFEVDHETDIQEHPVHEKPEQNKKEEVINSTTEDAIRKNSRDKRWEQQIPTSSKPNDSESGMEVAVASDNMDALVSRA